MNLNRVSHRKLIVHFRPIQAEDNSRSIINSLLRTDGVESAEYSGSRLTVTYMFPEATIESILSIIGRTADSNMQQPLNRFKNSILAVMEINERDNLAHAGGWHCYVEDIYLHHFDPGLSARIDIRKQTWRKYN